MKRIKSNHILTPDGEFSGYLYFDGGRISAISRDELPFSEEYDFGELYVSAGFIDIHTHGGGGFAFEATSEDVIGGCNFHLSHGVTSICPTVTSSYIGDMKRSVGEIKAAIESGRVKNNIIGAHLEGPYLSPSQTGAQGAEFITPPVFEDYSALIEEYPGVVARWTYAPERDEDCRFARFMSEHGVVTSAGHTDAVYADMRRAMDNGMSLVTHLYSCTSTVTRNMGFRSLGVIESAYLLDDLYVEIIADGKHLPPELIQMIYKIKGADRIALVSDSLSIAGTDVKTGRLQSTEFIIEDGVCKLLDRSAFAGSIATADRLVRVLVQEAGISMSEAVKMMSATPARIMGLSAKGTLEVGNDADITVFDGNIEICAVFVDGERQI